MSLWASIPGLTGPAVSTNRGGMGSSRTGGGQPAPQQPFGYGNRANPNSTNTNPWSSQMQQRYYGPAPVQQQGGGSWMASMSNALSGIGNGNFLNNLMSQQQTPEARQNWQNQVAAWEANGGVEPGGFIGRTGPLSQQQEQIALQSLIDQYGGGQSMGYNRQPYNPSGGERLQPSPQLAAPAMGYNMQPYQPQQSQGSGGEQLQQSQQPQAAQNPVLNRLAAQPASNYENFLNAYRSQGSLNPTITNNFSNTTQSMGEEAFTSRPVANILANMMGQSVTEERPNGGPFTISTPYYRAGNTGVDLAQLGNQLNRAGSNAARDQVMQGVQNELSQYSAGTNYDPRGQEDPNSLAARAAYYRNQGAQMQGQQPQAQPQQSQQRNDIMQFIRQNGQQQPQQQVMGYPTPPWEQLPRQSSWQPNSLASMLYGSGMPMNSIFGGGGGWQPYNSNRSMNPFSMY